MSRSIYMPDTSIQGDVFPAHVMWDRTDKLKIRIKLPPSIAIEQAYNTISSPLPTMENGWTQFEHFAVNGYLGLLMRSERDHQDLSSMEVLFELISGDGSREQHVRKIRLFRPALQLLRAPKQIKVTYNSRTGWCSVSEKVQVRNVGSGTALIGVEMETNDFQAAAPERLAEFGKSFFKDLEIRLKAFAALNPSHSQVIEDFLLIPEKLLSTKENYITTIKPTTDALTTALSHDKEFYAAFTSALIVSYLKNIQIITELTSFIEYLDSIGEGRVIILNSMLGIKPKKTQGTLSLTIYVKDLADNEYPPFKLPPIKVIWNGGGTIPVHQLFDWRTQKSKARRK